jgi:hypothetical protein
MTTDQITPEQIAAIKVAAEYRVGYILWLCEKLERNDNPLIRREAAKVLREMVSE